MTYVVHALTSFAEGLFELLVHLLVLQRSTQTEVSLTALKVFEIKRKP